jgi:hypothetical protein
VSDKLCPMTQDGRHKRRPWYGATGLGSDAPVRSGLACVKCHRAWRFPDVGDEMIPMYPDDQ